MINQADRISPKRSAHCHVWAQGLLAGSKTGAYCTERECTQPEAVPVAQQEDKHARRALKHLEPAQPPADALQPSHVTAAPSVPEVLLFDLVRSPGLPLVHVLMAPWSLDLQNAGCKARLPKGIS